MEYSAIDKSCFAVLDASARRVSGGQTDQPNRSMFMRDRDRLLYSKSFRRLSGKTQVYTYGSGDHRRTRLTHTLEVSQIARTISSRLGLNCDLTEAIALGHDIGHTPFGHAGERALHKLMSPNFIDDDNLLKQKYGVNELFVNATEEEILEYEKYFGFKHNLQSVRTAIRFEENYGRFGLDLTNYTLWGMCFHSGTQYKNNCDGEMYAETGFYKEYIDVMSLDNGNLARSFEAYVVSEADEIAQRHHDLEDAIRSGAVSREEAKNLVNKFLKDLMDGNDKKDLRATSLDNANDEEFIACVSRIVVNTLVNRLIEFSKKNLDVLKKTYSNAELFFLSHSQHESEIQKIISYVSITDTARGKSEVLENIEKFQATMAEKILNSYDVQRGDSKGKYIIKKLFQAYYSNPQQLPDYAIEPYLIDVQEYVSPASLQGQRNKKGAGHIRKKFNDHTQKNRDVKSRILLMRVICDYIAGMTDSFAVSEYKKLYD